MKLGATSFERPVGAHADEKELEYVSALLQTGDDLRVDGSIRPRDVQLFLLSRYGIQVEPERITELIFQDLAGALTDVKEGEEPCMDLVQFVSILLIPHFLDSMGEQSTLEKNEAIDVGDELGETNEAVLSDASPSDATNIDNPSDNLRQLLEHCMFGNRQSFCQHSDTENGLTITRQDLEDLLERHAEEKGSDKLVQSMLQITQESDSLGQALTKDIHMFDNTWKFRTTTPLQDVMQVMPNNDQDAGEETKAMPLERKFTASFVDYIADTVGDIEQCTEFDFVYGPLCFIFLTEIFYCQYRRPRFVMALWVTFVFSFIAYVRRLGSEEKWVHVSCDSSQACHFVQGALQWIGVMIHLGALGIIFIFMGSVGNSVYAGRDSRSLGTILLAMSAVILFCVLPFFVETSNGMFTTDGNKPSDQTYVQFDDAFDGGLIAYEDDTFVELFESSGRTVLRQEEDYNAAGDPFAAAYFIALIMGLCLLFWYLVDLFLVITPSEWVKAHPILATITMPGGLKTAQAQKEASFHKMTKMVNGTLSIHRKAHVRKSSVDYVEYDLLQTFHRFSHETEEVGGVMWTWLRILDGRLFHEEGVWFHSRLLAMGMAQVLVVVIVIFLAIVGYLNYENFAYSDTPTVQEQSVEILSTTFGGALNCTNARRFAFFGSSALASLLSLDINRIMDTYSFGQPVVTEANNTLSTIADTLANAPFNFVLDCVDSVIPSVDGQLFTQFSSVYKCMVAEIGDINSRGRELSATDLFRLQYYDAFGGRIAVESKLRSCGANDSVLNLIMNSTTYDTAAEENGTLAVFSEAVGITRAGYFVVITVAFIAAFVACAYLPIVLFPSYTSQVLRYRSGILASLHDSSEFSYLSKSLDTVTSLFPSSYWGAFITALAAGALFGFLAFLLVSNIGSSLVPWILGLALGFSIVLTIRQVILMSLRHVLFQNFYRKHVSGANIMFVMLEASNIALATGSAIARFVVIVLIGIVFIARVDTPFLAQGVGEVGPLKLDRLPFAFKRDLLCHEAHRHPYLELFGTICLLKLRCGEGFGSRAQASLRVLATLTLMPWLKKYRVQRASYVTATNEDSATEEKKDSTLLKVEEAALSGTAASTFGNTVKELDPVTLLNQNKMLEMQVEALKSKLARYTANGEDKDGEEEEKEEEEEEDSNCYIQ